MITRADIEQTIQQHLFDRDFCVDRLSDLLHISSSYLRMLVQHYYGISPLALIRKLRLQRAMELYPNQATIKAVGNSVGYCNERTFRNACYKEFGAPPTQVFNGKKLP